MFRKLRNKLIWMNLGITTVVIVVAFTAIYIFATQSANRRPPIPETQTEIYTDDFENVIEITIKREKQAAARDLLIMLIVSGVAIEMIVAFISYYLAEESIKPVREAYESQKVFIANASHEIKTPLAAIAANLEAADIHGNKWINNVEKETEKLSALNSELLTLARSDLIEKSKMDEVDLRKLLEEELKRFEPRLGKTKLQTEITAHSKIRLARTDLVQIINILMDNAIKYSDKKILVKCDDHELVVSNDGVLVDKKDLLHLFERFYQADKSSEGVGLGLSIAQSVAMRNGWKLTVKQENKLTSFVLRFS